MSQLIPIVKNSEQYHDLFKNNELWDKAILYLAEKYKLVGQPVRGAMGSHIVYRVGSVWIKLMAPIFAKDMDYELAGLKTVSGKLSVLTPEILAVSTLEGWSYVLLSHVEGESIRHSWSRYSAEEKQELSRQMARVSVELSCCQAEKEIQDRYDWNTFVQNQYEKIEEEQKKKKLPEPWLKTVKSFLHSIPLSDFLFEKPVFVHADLTYDHFLITAEPTPRVNAIIDMADCQLAHPEYEWIAPAIFLFREDRINLREYLKACGVPESKLNQRFSEKLLAWGLLHRYCAMNNFLKKELEETPAGDFSALALRLFPL